MKVELPPNNLVELPITRGQRERLTRTIAAVVDALPEGVDSNEASHALLLVAAALADASEATEDAFLTAALKAWNNFPEMVQLLDADDEPPPTG